MHGSVSVVVPVFRAAETLPDLAERLRTVLLELGVTFEVILVEDGGGDDSWMRIREIARKWNEFRGVRLARNFGQHNALLCGIRRAHGDVIVTMDDDLQNPPEEIPTLLAKLGDDVDVVYGTPESPRHSLARRVASRVTKFALAKAMGIEAAQSVSSFRAFRRGLREGFGHVTGPSVSIDVLLTWTTERFAAVTVRHDQRHHGKTNYTISALIDHALGLLTGFSTLPLRLASFVGFVSTAFGLAVLAYVLGNWMIRGSVVQGFTFLASTIAAFAGAQLFAIGVLGEYLARVHLRASGRPAFVEAETVGLEPPRGA